LTHYEICYSLMLVAKDDGFLMRIGNGFCIDTIPPRWDD
jgi:hypothetical protein